MQSQLDMFSGVADTSKRAYAEIVADGTEISQTERVYQAIMLFPFISRSELADVLQLRLASVCGRVNLLLKKQRVCEDGEKIDGVTGKSVARLKVKE